VAFETGFKLRDAVLQNANANWEVAIPVQLFWSNSHAFCH
jgi:hypothetical protein